LHRDRGEETIPKSTSEMLVSRQNSLKSLICRIDVTAFAGVMFALVAMFLLPAGIVVDYRGPSTNFAKVDHPISMPNALREDVLEVAVTRDGKIWLGHDVMLVDQLPAAIRTAVSNGSERKVYIRADMPARYGAVKQVLDAVQSAGIEKVAFLVDQRHPGQRTSDIERLRRFDTKWDPPPHPLTM
jgi:biopolymer transport protein TolR